MAFHLSLKPLLPKLPCLGKTAVFFVLPGAKSSQGLAFCANKLRAVPRSGIPLCGRSWERGDRRQTWFARRKLKKWRSFTGKAERRGKFDY